MTRNKKQCNVFAALGIKNATVLTYTSLCFNRRLTQVPFRRFSSSAQLKPLVKTLLDAGIPVCGYWADLDYGKIDARIKSGDRM